MYRFLLTTTVLQRQTQLQILFRADQPSGAGGRQVEDQPALLWSPSVSLIQQQQLLFPVRRTAATLNAKGKVKHSLHSDSGLHTTALTQGTFTVICTNCPPLKHLNAKECGVVSKIFYSQTYMRQMREKCEVRIFFRQHTPVQLIWVVWKAHIQLLNAFLCSKRLNNIFKKQTPWFKRAWMWDQTPNSSHLSVIFHHNSLTLAEHKGQISLHVGKSWLHQLVLPAVSPLSVNYLKLIMLQGLWEHLPAFLQCRLQGTFYTQLLCLQTSETSAFCPVACSSVWSSFTLTAVDFKHLRMQA